MTNQQVEAFRVRLKNEFGSQVENFVFMADIEDENGEQSTLMVTQGTNSSVIGLCELAITDVMTAREEANERE